MINTMKWALEPLEISGGYDDVDLDTTKAYNRVARETERNQAFWNKSRNTTHAASKQQKQNDGEKCGSNKIRGGRAVDEDGRVIPRQRGGKMGQGGQQQQQ